MLHAIKPQTKACVLTLIARDGTTWGPCAGTKVRHKGTEDARVNVRPYRCSPAAPREVM